MSGEQVELQRDCDAVEIPAGHKVTLTKGTQAYITQSLGGTYTLRVTTLGGLYRIDRLNADAIGKEIEPGDQSAEAESGDVESQVWTQLKTVYDPEIPVNIVDLGLVYDMQVLAGTEGGNRVEVKMTLTAPGCGMGGVIAQDARQKILGVAGVEDAEVDIVWDPPWNPQMISPEGRQLLGMD